jgi:hypothetical protein
MRVEEEGSVNSHCYTIPWVEFCIATCRVGPALLAAAVLSKPVDPALANWAATQTPIDVHVVPVMGPKLSPITLSNCALFGLEKQRLVRLLLLCFQRCLRILL